MLKHSKIALFLVSMFLVMGYCFAERPSMAESQQSMLPEHKGMMAGKGKMGDRPMMAKQAMAKMMPAQMVATKDGGVIILKGKTLLKYDRNLELIKKVDLEFDCAGERQKQCAQEQKTSK